MSLQSMPQLLHSHFIKQKMHVTLTTTSTTNCTLPTEILHIIVNMLLEDHKTLSSISSFALACYKFRSIALRCFFSTLTEHVHERWIQLTPVLGSASVYTR
jgi:hypothetical protein